MIDCGLQIALIAPILAVNQERQMDRDPSENHLDTVARELPATGENDTGEVGTQAARIEEKRRKAGTAPEKGHQPVQTKSVPRP